MRARVCVSVCLSAGTRGRAVRALLAEEPPPPPPPLGPALLAAQVRSARHFVRFIKSSSGRSRGSGRPSAPGLAAAALRPGRAARRRRRESGSGDCGICRGGACRLPGPGRRWTAGRTETEQLRRGAGSGERRPGGTGCGLAAAAQRREPEAETHRRERRERPAIVPCYSFAAGLFPPFPHPIRMI